jgi:hypothetical protein
MSAQLAALYSTVSIEGVAAKLRMRKAVVTFTEPPFRGGLHQIFDWSTVDNRTVRELADDVSFSLREGLRRHRRGQT